MKENYSKDIAGRIREYLENEEIRYEFEEERGLFRFGISIPGSLQKLNYVINIKRDDYNVYVFPLFSADKNNQEMMSQIEKFFNMINYSIRNGSFEMDDSDGEIRYRSYVECVEMELSYEAVRNSIHWAAIVYMRYGKGILHIIFNNMSAKDAFDMCVQEVKQTEEKRSNTETAETDDVSEEETEYSESALEDMIARIAESDV